MKVQELIVALVVSTFPVGLPQNIGPMHIKVHWLKNLRTLRRRFRRFSNSGPTLNARLTACGFLPLRGAVTESDQSARSGVEARKVCSALVELEATCTSWLTSPCQAT